MALVLSNKGSPGVSENKESACNAEDPDLIPGWGNSSGEGNGNQFQSSCMENPIGSGEAWQAPIHGITESLTQLSNKHFHFHCLMNHFLDCDNAQGLPRWLASQFSETIYIYKGKVHSLSFFLKF